MMGQRRQTLGKPRNDCRGLPFQCRLRLDRQAGTVPGGQGTRVHHILLDAQEIRWHILVDGKYQLFESDADGIWRSRIFPGLWLDGKALFQGDMVTVLATLQKGLVSREHKAFVKELARRKKKGDESS